MVAGRIPKRPAAYHAGGAGDPADAGEAVGGEDAAPATDGGGVGALFAGESDGASGEGATSGGEQGASPSRESALTDESATGEVPAGDEAPTSDGLRAHAKATDAPPHGGAAADAVLAASPGEKPELRAGGGTPPAGPAAPAVPPEVRFAAANHGAIVTSMRGELMPDGGSMRIRLDPPQLGALLVTVQIRDGVVTASFETSNDEATRLLGHSLNQLKTALESQGVAVDKLQVQQAPREAQANHTHDDGRREQGGPSQDQEQNARQEQQRREMLRRMWRRLSGGQDPLDLTA